MKKLKAYLLIILFTSHFRLESNVCSIDPVQATELIKKHNIRIYSIMGGSSSKRCSRR